MKVSMETDAHGSVDWAVILAFGKYSSQLQNSKICCNVWNFLELMIVD